MCREIDIQLGEEGIKFGIGAIINVRWGSSNYVGGSVVTDNWCRSWWVLPGLH